MKARFRTKVVLAGGGATAAAVVAALAIALPASSSAQSAGANVDSPYWGGSSTNNVHYQDISQITPANVSKLGVAFTLSAGADQSGWETDPVEQNGVLYYSSPTDQVFAVNAATGKKVWSYTPKVNFFLAIAGGGGGAPASRGVTLYNGKVYDLTFDDQLIALQQATGEVLFDKPIENARAGISESSPGTIYAPPGKTPAYVVGSAEGDSGVRGAVQAFNANTGALLWRTFLIPGPGKGWVPKGGDHGGGDVWMPPTVDQATGTVYVGTGNPSPDVDVSVRGGPHAADKWSDATVALNATTGKIEWGHTEVYGDGWDYDTHQAPAVYSTTLDGKTTTVIGQGNKSGFYSILNQSTGKLIAKSPYLSKYSEPHKYASAKGTEDCPGDVGGLEFGPPSVDPQTNMVYLQTINECAVYITQAQNKTAEHSVGQPDFGGSFYPAPNSPDTGGFVAINDSTGKVVFNDKLPIESYGGVVTTSGGVAFFGEGSELSGEPKLSGGLAAVNVKTGKRLWFADLGVPTTAAPLTYEVDGTQYVAVAADSDIVVFKLGGKKPGKLKPSVPAQTTPANRLPKLGGYTKVGADTYYKTSSKQALFKFTAGEAKANAGFSFDGYFDGDATFEVPEGWDATFELNNEGAVQHSVEITSSLKTPLTAISNELGEPQEAPEPATHGIKKGSGTAVLSWDADVAGSYYLVCGVPGHLQAGMWVHLKVVKGLKAPTIVTGPKQKTPGA